MRDCAIISQNSMRIPSRALTDVLWGALRFSDVFDSKVKVYFTFSISVYGTAYIVKASHIMPQLAVASDANSAHGVLALGGYFRNFWVGMCHWDPGTLSLY